MATKKMTRAPATRVDNIIHEIGRTEHRIVFVAADGKIRTGEWAPHKEIASFESLLACHPDHAGKLPVGVFTARPTNAGVLQ